MNDQCRAPLCDRDTCSLTWPQTTAVLWQLQHSELSHAHPCTCSSQRAALPESTGDSASEIPGFPLQPALEGKAGREWGGGEQTRIPTGTYLR